MAQIPYRGNLSAAVFPMTIAKSGRSVINPGADQNFDKRVDPGASPGSVGIPQILYCENTFPTPEGYQSIGLKTTGTIEHSSPILVLETMRLATEIDETTVTPDTDILDEGDELTTWIRSPNDTGGADFREILQDAVEGDPAPSYRFQYDRNEQIPAYMYKNFSIGGTSSLTLTFNFRFDGDAQFKSAFVKFLNSSTGVGPGIFVGHNTSDPDDSIRLWMGNAWSAVYTNTELIKIDLAAPLVLDAWYELKIQMYKNPDSTYTITANLFDDAAVNLGTLNYTGNFSLGGYIGFVQETGVASDGTRFYTFYDNIHIEADAADISYTSVTGIENVEIAFRADNTIRWNIADNQGFSNFTGIFPVGFESPVAPEDLSWTLVRGELFVCIKNADNSTHIYRVVYDDLGPTLEFEEVTATISSSLGLAFNINNVIGITGAYNYLILLTPDSVIWSSTTDLTNFAPSLVSGAGSERIGNLKGDIQFAKEHVAGFFLYTNNNVIFATYTGNSRYPWKFREVSDSSGYTFPQQVVGDSNSAIQYGISNAKIIQAIQPQSAELIAQEATNFFERSTTWDVRTGTVFSVMNQSSGANLLPASGKYRIWLALDRYLLIGYYSTSADEAPTNFNVALVYDILQRRYGKINDVYHQVLISENSFYVVNFGTGEKRKIEMNIEDAVVAGSGVLLLGKFMLARDHMLQLDNVILESGTSGATLNTPSYTLDIIPTYDGKTFLPAVTPIVDATRSTGLQMHYNCRLTAQNHCLLVRGKYDLVGVDLKGVDAGKR